MYACRYLKWIMVAGAAYLFFSIYLYYFSWLAIRISGCLDVVGACGSLESKLNGFVRPYGILSAGIILLTATVLRIHFLKISPIWGLALFIWFGASADFFFAFGNLWFAKIDTATILGTMPIDTLFLVVLIGFLCFPLELYKQSPKGGLRLIYYVAGFTASYSFTLSIANSEKALAFLRQHLGEGVFVEGFQFFQARMHAMLSLGHDGIMPTVVALAVFVSSLSYLLVMRKSPAGQTLVPA
jgi:hypothetical protein